MHQIPELVFLLSIKLHLAFWRKLGALFSCQHKASSCTNSTAVQCNGRIVHLRVFSNFLAPNKPTYAEVGGTEDQFIQKRWHNASLVLILT